MDLKDEQICRLCFLSDNDTINIFNNTESDLNIAEIIGQYFQWEISESDYLPNAVCVVCWTKTESFHKFHQFVTTARDNYLKRLLEDHVKDEYFPNETLDAYTEDIPLEPTVNVIVDEKPDRISSSDMSDIEGTNEMKNVFQINIKNKCEGGDTYPLDSLDMKFDSNMKSTMNALGPISISEVSSAQIQQIIDQYFDMACDYCGIQFVSLEKAKIHYEKCHRIANGYIKCCKTKLSLSRLVKDHILFHLNPDIFKCELCDIVFSTRKSLNRHKFNHRASEIRKYICDICEKGFGFRAQLYRHITTVHASQLKYPCDLCNKSFRSKKYLAAHFQISHNDQKSDDEIVVETLVQTVLKTANSQQKDQIIADHFDMSCDVCQVQLESLKAAKTHYLTEHKIPVGYVKCCNLKLKLQRYVQDHIAWHLDPEVFKCKICQKLLKSRATFKFHIGSHKAIETEKFSCRFCCKPLSSTQELKRHLWKIHHTQENNLKASPDLSNMNMESMDTANENQSENTGYAELTIPEYFDMTCDICSITLESLDQAKQHYLQEHTIKLGYVKCCDAKLKNRREVLDHIALHSNPEIFKCDECHKCFKTNLKLRRHKKSHANRMHECNLCEKNFRCNAELQAHQMIHDQKERKFECEFCKKRYPFEVSLRNHVNRIHMRNDHQICEICAKVCKSKSLLFAHLRTHSEKRPELKQKVQCDICGAWLANRYILKTHMLIHTSGSQKCEQCGKVAQGLTALQSHIRKVHIDANLKCHLCNKSFKLAAALKDHVATHTGEKLYKCAYCFESFIWRSNCYSHQKKAHPREWSDDQAKKAVEKLADAK